MPQQREIIHRFMMELSTGNRCPTIRGQHPFTDRDVTRDR